MLNKKQFIKIVENLSFAVGEKIFIHHPITEDIINVIIKKLKTNTLLVSIPEDSDYYGQPDFEIKKYVVLSK